MACGRVCSYQQSLAQNMTDDELDVLKSFRVPGRVLFVRSAKEHRNQMCVSAPRAFCLSKCPSVIGLVVVQSASFAFTST